MDKDWSEARMRGITLHKKLTEEWKNQSVYELAQKIFDYLPIRRDTLENDYIDHLWQAFTALYQGDEVARPFMIMPFHLLFMLVIQYKVLRIYKEQKEKYELALTTKNPRDGEKDILAPESPFTIAFLGESEIVDLLKIAGLSADDAHSIKKSVIRYRNDKIAHAKGYIEQNLETKIAEYFDWLETLQNVYRPMNQNIANDWLAKISFRKFSGIMNNALFGSENKEDLDTFFETYFLDSCFSSRDFGDIIGTLLNTEQLDFEQWTQAINKGLKLSYDQTVSALRKIFENKINDKKRVYITRILNENGEIIGNR